MRLKAALLAVILTLGVAGAATAGPVWFGLMGGAAVPTGDFSDQAGTGFDFGGTGTWMVNDMWGVGADVAYHMWNGSDDYNAYLEDPAGGDFGVGSEAKFNALQATAHAAVMIPSGSMVKPWLKAGLGMYTLGGKIEGGTTEVDFDSESKFGFNAGAGLNWAASSNMSLGIGAAYHQIMTKDEDTGAENTNLFTVNLSVLWSVSPQ
jgi:opacity protein-like surface antigen